ncbi:MAG TPA: NADH-quinone oxidoreductase subunit L [Anaerolineae bacterium]|nr:NADH-quinone oxidoreductase subunit L [Anaerolineae bacterium]
MSTTMILLTICLPWIGGLFIWIIGDRHPRTQHALAACFAVAAGLSSLALLPFTSDSAAITIEMGSVFGRFTFVPDGLGVFLAIIAAVVGSLAVIFSIDYMHGEEQLGRYYSLVLFFIGAMAGLGLSGSFLLMFLFWEITAFCSYALISFHNDDPKAVAGGIKALIMTQLGGIGLLVGALIAHDYLNSYQIHDFLANASALPPNTLTFIAFGFLLAAAAKSAQVPLHTWLPDAMEAPTPVTALIHAATMVNAGVYLLARFYPAFESVPGWSVSVITVGLLSAILAAMMAIVSTDLKRALAYSTVSQLGYMVFAVGTGGVFASQYHLLSHSIFKALLFLSAGTVIHVVGTRDMRLMGGLGKQMPITRLVFIIGSLALAGIPIANGFFSKELVLETGLEYGPVWAYAGMLIGTGLTALYTLRMIAMVFYGETRVTEKVHDAPPAMRISLGILAFGTLTSWLLAGPFGHMLEASLPFHDLHFRETSELVIEILSTPATWIVLLVVALGLGSWFLRKTLRSLEVFWEPLKTFALKGWGFEWINLQVIHLTRNLSSTLRITQTGQLNWNILGIIGGLSILLTFLAWGGMR